MPVPLIATVAACGTTRYGYLGQKAEESSRKHREHLLVTDEPCPKAGLLAHCPQFPCPWESIEGENNCTAVLRLKRYDAIAVL